MNLVVLLIGFAILYTIQLFVARSFFLKLLVITYLFAVSSAIYFSFDSYKGWPADEKIKKAYLLAVHIVQPSSSSEGKIYIWTLPENKEQNILYSIFNFISTDDMPRAYIIPFSQKNEEEFTEAQEELEKGMVVILEGETTNKSNNTVNGNENNDKNVTGEGNGGSDEDYGGPRITIVSPDQVMRK